MGVTLTWWNWLVAQVAERIVTLGPLCGNRSVSVMIRTKDKREFPPFSIEWDGATLILCEDEGAG